jgi:hypothetical protein
VYTIGWWATFPSEPINGVMVAQTTTLEQIEPGGPVAPAKGTIVQGLPGQVRPIDLQNRVIDIARNVEASIPQLAVETFGEFSASLPSPSLDHWTQSLWSFRADNTYLRGTKELLDDTNRGIPDLLMVYFGMPDVVGHRFWRHAFPEAYEHPPTQEEIDGFSSVIATSYVWVDRAIGEILDFYDGEATVVVVSDHGMRSLNTKRDFTGREGLRSGHHRGGQPGVLIVSGMHAQKRRAGVRPDVLPEKRGHLPVLGRVHDLAPTLLALQNLPIGRDMDGAVLEEVLASDFLERYPLTFVDTYDTDEWLKDRPGQMLGADVESERLRQLRSLGYIR